MSYVTSVSVWFEWFVFSLSSLGHIDVKYLSSSDTEVCANLEPCNFKQNCELGAWNHWCAVGCSSFAPFYFVSIFFVASRMHFPKIQENFKVRRTFAARSECSCSCFGIRERNRVIEQFASGDGLHFPQTHFFCVGMCAAFSRRSLWMSLFNTFPGNFFVQLTFTDLQVVQWHCEGNCPLQSRSWWGRLTQKPTCIQQSMCVNIYSNNMLNRDTIHAKTSGGRSANGWHLGEMRNAA